jgi:hypothetical protein
MTADLRDNFPSQCNCLIVSLATLWHHFSSEPDGFKSAPANSDASLRKHALEFLSQALAHRREDRIPVP